MAEGKKQETAGRWLSVLYRRSQSHLTRVLEPYGIGWGQIGFLIPLYWREGISQDELACQLDIDKGTTARALCHLEKNGCIERRKDEGDGRINRVYLTEKAQEIRPALREILLEWNETLFQGFNEEERDQVLEALRRMAFNATEALKKTKDDGEN